MDATLKIGGSLVDKPAKLRTLCEELSKMAKNYRITAVPGGGKFADIVRELDDTFHLTDTDAHNMAILAMDQYGIFLSKITPDSCIIRTLESARKKSEAGLLPFLLPSSLMAKKNPLPHSWDVTSDSITAFIAAELNSEKLILVTDVDGIYNRDPKWDPSVELIPEMSISDLSEINARTSVDKYLSNILSHSQLDCYIVNGIYPKRIWAILENETTKCTRIRA